MDYKEYKTIWITKINHQKISSFGDKSDTFNDIISKMVKVYGKYYKPKEDKRRGEE